jgi:CSLREA domain-containing protein
VFKGRRRVAFTKGSDGVAAGLAFVSCAALRNVRAASTLTVTTTSDGTDANPGNGTCETASGNGVCSLRAAVQEANALAGADSIVVPAGTYPLTISGANEEAAATGDLDILDDLNIAGAGASNTVIDGQAADRIFDVAPSAFGAPTPDADVSIARITIQNGQAIGGGGIQYAYHLAVNDSVIRDNVSTFQGGGIGAASNVFADAQLTLTDSLVIGNRAPFFGGNGAGIYAGSSVSLRVTRSRIAANSGEGSGAGIDASGIFPIHPVLTDVTIDGNTTTGPLGVGGGIVAGCAIITGSTINGNVASRNGGGIQNVGACGAAITNSTVSGNRSATVGGGIGTTDTLALTNVTVVGNAAATSGGGIFQFGIPSATVVQNTIVAANAGGNCDGQPITSVGHNIASDTTCNLAQPTDMQNTDPLVGPLANNGGPTLTHALMPNSPAIDAAADVGLTIDQRGVARPQGAGFDIGAFERQPPNHPPICTGVNGGPNLWPPDHRLDLITLTGATDPDGDPLTTTVRGVTQDEPLDGVGDGHTAPDAIRGPASDQVYLRSERSGLGDGRVYRVSFDVTDGRGGSCTGTTIVGVPHDQGAHSTPIDSGGVFVDF